jgi:hypothetical protein
MSTRRALVGWALLTGGATVGLAAFLPWATVSTLSVTGVSARWGVATVVIGALAVLSAVQWWTHPLGERATRPVLAVGGLGGVAATTIATVGITRMPSAVISTDPDEHGFLLDLLWDVGSGVTGLDEVVAVHAGIGIWLTLVAGAFTLTTAASGLVMQRNRSTSTRSAVACRTLEAAI